MIEELKFYIDQTEHNPKLKSIFLKIAELPEGKQKAMLELIKIIVRSKGGGLQ